MDGLRWASFEVACGLALLLFGGEMLVRGAARLADAMRIPPLLIGLTVVAFGTSAPELAVSLQSCLAGEADIALGNIVGSNILNVLLILGLSAFIVPLIVSSDLIRRDVPLMILASLLVLAFGLDGKIGRLDGLLLFGSLLAYTYWCVRQSRRESQAVQAEFAQATPPAFHGEHAKLRQIGWVVAGVLLLGVGSEWLVNGAVTVAETLGVSQLIIGLTIVAAGTSLPEAVTSIVAACRGERDIAVGNVIGSNLFNILGVLGLTSLIAPRGVTVSPVAMRFDIPVMITVAIACLPIVFTGNRISRGEGGLFCLYYAAYTLYLVLDATGNDFSRTLADVMTVFVIPLTFITLAITVLRSLRERSTSGKS